jgi:hypothetical protein
MSNDTLTPVVVRERRSWRGSVRWFAAEFLVVVSGILVALALQAWYQGRHDARVARVYLNQLGADLNATERDLRIAIAQDSGRADLGTRIVIAFHSDAPLPPDSARSWLKQQFGFFSDPRPLLATVTTLIETGDIKLIADPSLRSAIVAYASLMELDMDELSRDVNRLRGANDVVSRRWEYHSLAPLLDPRARSASPYPDRYTDAEAAAMLPRFMRAWPVILSDADMRGAEQVRLVAFTNRVFYMQRMLDSTIRLRDLLPAPQRNRRS